RGRAEVDAAERGPVRVEPEGRARPSLAQITPAAADVAANVVRVLPRQVARAADGAGDDPLPEAGSKALDLRLDRRGRVCFRPVGDGGERPGGGQAVGSPRVVEKAVRGEEDERPAAAGRRLR